MTHFLLEILNLPPPPCSSHASSSSVIYFTNPGVGVTYIRIVFTEKENRLKIAFRLSLLFSLILPIFVHGGLYHMHAYLPFHPTQIFPVPGSGSAFRPWLRGRKQECESGSSDTDFRESSRCAWYRANTVLLTVPQVMCTVGTHFCTYSGPRYLPNSSLYSYRPTRYLNRWREGGGGITF